VAAPEFVEIFVYGQYLGFFEKFSQRRRRGKSKRVIYYCRAQKREELERFRRRGG
jgi:hypothetical protein